MVSAVSYFSLWASYSLLGTYHQVVVLVLVLHGQCAEVLRTTIIFIWFKIFCNNIHEILRPYICQPSDIYYPFFT